MTIRFDDLKPADPEMAKPAGTVQVIIKVREPGYVPPAVLVRARIDDHLFTADVDASELPRLDDNPKVVSVSPGRKLRIVE